MRVCAVALTNVNLSLKLGMLGSSDRRVSRGEIRDEQQALSTLQ
jgi:hypothetical protein